MRQKEDMSKIPNDDVYKAIAQHCSLSKEQVREVFKAYHDVIYALIDTPNRPKGLAIPLPLIGWFELTYKKGLKAGTHKGGNLRPMYSKDVIDVVVTEDKPDYELLRFKVQPSVNKWVREKTTDLILRRKKNQELIKELGDKYE